MGQSLHCAGAARNLFGRATLAALAVALACAAHASSHSDAPLIKQDPQANLTDLYAFVGTRYDNATQRVLNVVMAVRPFSDPGDGVVFERFADDALYSIHIAHPVTGATVARYDFRFSDVNPVSAPGLKNPNTALSFGLGTQLGAINDIGDARQNYTQAFTVTKDGTLIGSGLPIAPPNLGARTTPHYNDTFGRAISGATTFAALDVYTRQAVQSLSTGEVVFAGSRDDGFFADTAGFHDLLDGRIVDNNGSLADGLGQDGGGPDTHKGFNTLAIAIQIPLASLPSYAFSVPFADLAKPLPAYGTANGVGVYASVSRPRITLRRTDGEPVHTLPWIQVSRLGNPLFNQDLVALKDKDTYNRTAPTVDAASFATYTLNPEPATLVNAIFGTSVPASGRTDLQGMFVPDVIRVDTTTAPVRLAGQAGFSRFGLFGGDTVTDGAGRVKSGGWPNGRRFGDDVVDIFLAAIVSGPSYAAVVLFGDNVAANDLAFHQVFPFAATPHSGAGVNLRQSVP
jgi:hypothetical protein